MVTRHFWIEHIQKAWQRRSIVWLTGVRRVGKTILTQSVPDIEYFDCELPRVRATMEDPEGFLAGLKGRRIVLDEIHRLTNPSELLKIAADYYPTTKIIATGSSSLGASTKFKDTLAGRKTELWLTPLMSRDLRDFNRQDLEHRFLHGGLPPFFLSFVFPERDIQEWMDAYWSKDIQELFRLERRHSFQKFVELLMAQSGGIFEATHFAQPCEVNRTTISNYLKVLELTFVATVVRPFSSRRSNEIIAAPKVYGFDTGFVCYFRGWHELRRQDMGALWEHFVLNEIQAQLQMREVSYWRDKRGHEVDFVIVKRGKPPVAIECKWSTKDYDPTNILAFARRYPKAKFYIVAHDVDRSFIRKMGDITLQFASLASLIDSLQ